MNDSHELLTAEELAARLAISPRTVVAWARSGRIPEVRLSPKVRRFSFPEVVAAVKARAPDPKDTHRETVQPAD